jgi:diadenosine tetraphosphate (Ap4A) HIT family hydrolase
MSIDHPHSGNTYTLSDEERFCLEGCSTYSQYHLMRTSFETEKCVFCHLDRTRNNVIWEEDEEEGFMVWAVPAGMGKKRPLTHHILVVPKRHVRFAADLKPHEWLSLGKALKFTKEHFWYQGGLLHAREGDMRKNAGTVPHLHFNIFEPNGTAEVRVPVMKDQFDRQANRERTTRFASFYTAGITPEQFDDLVQNQLCDRQGDYLWDKI